MVTSALLVTLSFVWLGIAWFFRKARAFHIPAMSLLVLFDLLFPVYLYLTHDWWKRLIVDGEAFSFLIWSHLILVMVLYALYVLQIMVGRAMLQEASSEPTSDEYKRYKDEHHKQFLGILIIRLLVFASGALLIVPAASIPS